MAYATRAHFSTFGLAYPWMRGIPNDVVEAHLDAASLKIDGYLRKRLTLPLVDYGNDLRLLTCQVAACTLAHVRGFDGAAPDEQVVKAVCEMAAQELARIEQGTWLPSVTDSSSGAEEGVASQGGLEIASNLPRGWDRPTNTRTRRTY
jgi:phage gp36-like protein